MTTASPPRSRFERPLVAVVAVAVTAITVWFMYSNPFTQLARVLGAMALAFEGVLFGATWRQGVRWLFSRSALRFHAWLIVGMLTAVAVYYNYQNWSGRRAWRSLCQEAETRGESVALSSIIPPPVPAEDNFLEAPGIRPALEGEGPLSSAPTLDAMKRVASAPWTVGESTDLLRWLVLFTPAATNQPTGNAVAVAGDLLQVLGSYETPFAAFRAAVARPSQRFALDYERGFLAGDPAHVGKLRNLQRVTLLLGAKASAELAQQNPDEACADTLAALRTADCLKNEPFAYSHYFRTLLVLATLQPIWEGLATHRWTEPQLGQLEACLAKTDLLSEYRHTRWGETLMMIDLADQFQAFLEGRQSAAGQQLAKADGPERYMGTLARLLYPRGWLYHDRAWLLAFHQRHATTIPLLTLDRGELRSITDPFLAVYVVPRIVETYTRLSEEALYAHTATQLAVVACALERYRLRNGNYPDTLQALVPDLLETLPKDQLRSEGTFTYQQKGDSGFQLYSFGLNHRDDGGQPTPSETDYRGIRQIFPRLQDGDWTWPKPN